MKSIELLRSIASQGHKVLGDDDKDVQDFEDLVDETEKIDDELKKAVDELNAAADRKLGDCTISQTVETLRARALRTALRILFHPLPARLGRMGDVRNVVREMV